MQGATLMAYAIQQAESGVDYDRKAGAACPFCGHKVKVQDTRPWTGNSRIRYHRCRNERCPLYEFERSIKSVESLG